MEVDTHARARARIVVSLCRCVFLFILLFFKLELGFIERGLLCFASRSGNNPAEYRAELRAIIGT